MFFNRKKKEEKATVFSDLDKGSRESAAHSALDAIHVHLLHEYNSNRNTIIALYATLENELNKEGYSLADIPGKVEELTYHLVNADHPFFLTAGSHSGIGGISNIYLYRTPNVYPLFDSKETERTLFGGMQIDVNSPFADVIIPTYGDNSEIKYFTLKKNTWIRPYVFSERLLSGIDTFKMATPDSVHVRCYAGSEEALITPISKPEEELLKTYGLVDKAVSCGSHVNFSKTGCGDSISDLVQLMREGFYSRAKPTECNIFKDAPALSLYSQDQFSALSLDVKMISIEWVDVDTTLVVVNRDLISKALRKHRNAFKRKLNSPKNNLVVGKLRSTGETVTFQGYRENLDNGKLEFHTTDAESINAVDVELLDRE